MQYIYFSIVPFQSAAHNKHGTGIFHILRKIRGEQRPGVLVIHTDFGYLN